MVRKVKEGLGWIEYERLDHTGKFLYGGIVNRTQWGNIKAKHNGGIDGIERLQKFICRLNAGSPKRICFYSDCYAQLTNFQSNRSG